MERPCCQHALWQCRWEAKNKAPIIKDTLLLFSTRIVVAPSSSTTQRRSESHQRCHRASAPLQQHWKWSSNPLTMPSSSQSKKKEVRIWWRPCKTAAPRSYSRGEGAWAAQGWEKLLVLEGIFYHWDFGRCKIQILTTECKYNLEAQTRVIGQLKGVAYKKYYWHYPLG